MARGTACIEGGWKHQPDRLRRMEITRESGMRAFMSLRAQARANGVSGMTLDEINDEIRRTRYGGAGQSTNFPRLNRGGAGKTERMREK